LKQEFTVESFEEIISIFQLLGIVFDSRQCHNMFRWPLQVQRIFLKVVHEAIQESSQVRNKNGKFRVVLLAPRLSISSCLLQRQKAKHEICLIKW